MRTLASTLLALFLSAVSARAEAGSIVGVVRDETGRALPGATVQLVAADRVLAESVTESDGGYRIDGVRPGKYSLRLSLVNFGRSTRDVTVSNGEATRVDIVMHLSLSADVTVTGNRRSPTSPMRNPGREPRRHRAVGEPGRDHRAAARRAADHAGGRGARNRAGRDHQPAQRRGQSQPVLPARLQPRSRHRLRDDRRRHAGQHADARARPGLLGSQFPDPRARQRRAVSRRARTSPIRATSPPPAPRTSTTRTRSTGRSCASAAATRASAARWSRRRRRSGAGTCSAALEVEHNDGPWTLPDDYRKVNGVVRYSQGDAVNGLSLTGMGYRGKWNSTDQIPQRAIDAGLDRPLRRHRSDRRRRHLSLQRVARVAARARQRRRPRSPPTASATTSNLFSNFTFFLDDPVHGDQFHQADHRFVSGAKVEPPAARTRWGGRAVQNTFGVQLRNDDITNVGLYHTEARQLLDTVRQDAVLQTSGGVYAQNEIAVDAVAADARRAPRRRLPLSRRRRAIRRTAARATPGSSARRAASSSARSSGTELYVERRARLPQQRRARHDDHARSRRPAKPSIAVTPLVRATGRRGRRPHRRDPASADRRVTLWTLTLASELVFVGDAGTTEAGPAEPSLRRRVRELLRAAAVADRSTATCRCRSARFTDVDPAGDRIPGAVETVVSAGATRRQRCTTSSAACACATSARAR